MRLRKERLEDSHPRAIMALLAVRAKQEEVAPVDIVVTDAVTYDIFRYDGSDVLLYRGLDATEVGDAADTSVTPSPDPLFIAELYS